MIVLSIVTIAGLSFAEVQRASLRCTDVIISIEKNSSHSNFVTEEDIYNAMNSNRNMLIGKELAEINVPEIESTLKANPTILDCETFFSLKGELRVNVVQRTPIVRVVSQNASFYIDENGVTMPLSKRASARVMVASGEIFEQYQPNVNVADINESNVLQQIYEMAKIIRNDEMFLPLIEQIYVTSSQEFVLGSKIGPSKIEFGTMDNYDVKFRHLKAFYKAEKVRENWNLYNSLSLKFKNQIVCTKK